MPTKAQHTAAYQPLPAFLSALRVQAGLTQRDIGKRLRRPQSWVCNCENGNRRVDLAEFCQWCSACDVDPVSTLRRFLRMR